MEVATTNRIVLKHVSAWLRWNPQMFDTLHRMIFCGGSLTMFLYATKSIRYDHEHFFNSELHGIANCRHANLD